MAELPFAHQSRLLSLLQKVRVLTLSTFCKREFESHCVSLYFYFSPDLEFVFLSKPDSEHSKQLKENSACAISLYLDSGSVTDIKGLQAKGKAQLIENKTEKKQWYECYQNRFSFIQEQGLSERALGLDLYIFKPKSLTLIDNSIQLFHKETWNFS